MRRFQHVIVIGGSLAGLMAARVLSDYFRRVTVIERDPHPEAPEPRKGVPQGRHVHIVLEAGVTTLRSLFPGIVEELEAAGALRVDAARDTVWYHYGAWKPRFVSGIDGVMASRPLLELHVRRRVEALPNVSFRYGCSAEDLVADAARERVTGVRVKGDAGEEEIAADLVVDAAGRGTRAPRWLEALGYSRPEAEEVGVDVTYTSALYKRPADFREDWRFLAVYSRVPEGRRIGYVMEVEGGRWVVTLVGYFGEQAPAEEKGFLEHARSLPVPDVYDAIKDAAPVTPFSTFKIPASRFFHYEKLRRMPEGFVVLGDSVCALNPIYGQGMTMAILGSKLLQDVILARVREGRDLRGLPRVFQKKLHGIVGPAWLLSASMDLKYPEARGKRAPGLSVVQWAFTSLIDMTSQDVEACRAFYEMVHMRRGPEALARADILVPFLRYGVKSLFVPLSERANTSRRPAAP